MVSFWIADHAPTDLIRDCKDREHPVRAPHAWKDWRIELVV